ncbi:hypothetical protein M2163_003554 [Streptomyces sp. SAI-135]|uniref:hypothetical protein n=1 Tax=unclassified Streptomyces TaxID=2593676 RepID=UPI002473AE12|nr:MULTISPECIES: hypothetical protein [unclassified Streptomyces]MDH6519461.1 hypothetical protein [Streptomyces sp. SAI-090]MDH6616446.1 hypothetical protein [Streptomyces sp. SAI-135]
MPITHEPLHRAAEDLVMAVLAELAETASAPQFGLQRDHRSWRRCQQEIFLVEEREQWRWPNEFSSREWWYRFPAHKALREVIRDHEVLRSRIDTLVGYPSSLLLRRLEDVVVRYLLTPVVEAARAYRFDGAAFEAAYATVEAGLFAKTVCLVEYVPLLGFDMSQAVSGTPLPDGLTIRPMTDGEVSEALRVMGIPIAQLSSTNSLNLSRFHQNALVLERDLSVHSGYSQHPEAGTPSPFDAAVDRMLIALRIVCGGSVTYGRPMRMQSRDDFDAQPHASSSLTEVHHPVEDRPTLLVDAVTLGSLREVYDLLGKPGVQNERFLLNALRRLIMAGSRALPEDRLIDLCITAESLFIQHRGLSRRREKREHLVAGARALLSGDPYLGAEDQHVEQLIEDIYRRRNTEMHGDVAQAGPSRLLNGAMTSDLQALVGDFERLLRRAAHLVLIQIAGGDGGRTA